MNVPESIQLAARYRQEGKIRLATDIYIAILTEEPDNIEALHKLSEICYLLENYDLAISLIKKVIYLCPDHAQAYYHLGIALKEKGFLDEAIHCYQKALQLNPQDALSYSNMGNAFLEKCQIDEAIRCYHISLQVNPDDPLTHWHLSIALLLSGNLIQGWEQYQWRFNAFPYKYPRRNLSKPLWEGNNISGRTILFTAEQGFGDMIQFVRYAPLVAQSGARVMLECQSELTSLLKNIDGIEQIVAQGDQLPDFDVHCPLLSLPFIFGTTLENIPANIPYIRADFRLVQEWQNKIQNDNSQFKIGLVWASRPGRLFEKKSLPFFLYSSLSSIDGIAFYSLQKGEAAKEAKDNANGMGIMDYTEDIKDFSDTAALIENLDLIISVDTAVAHLAGALGKPVWLLLFFFPDWRWLLNREDSPWYPSMTLYRQPSPGDWETVMKKVSQELRKMKNNGCESQS